MGTPLDLLLLAVIVATAFVLWFTTRPGHLLAGPAKGGNGHGSDEKGHAWHGNGNGGVGLDSTAKGLAWHGNGNGGIGHDPTAKGHAWHGNGNGGIGHDPTAKGHAWHGNGNGGIGHGHDHGQPGNGNGNGNGRAPWPTPAYYRRTARQAGFEPQALLGGIWMAKLLLVIGLPLLLLVLWPFDRLPALPWLILVAVLGFFLPDIWLESRWRRRRRQISWGLSYFIDMMVALIHAGLSPGEAFLRAGRTCFRGSHPLAREVSLIGREIEAGRDPVTGFQALAGRTGLPEAAVLAATLTTGSRLGVPIVVSLESQADILRARRREEGLSRINAAGVRAVIPVMLCGLPLLAVLVFFPPVSELLGAVREVGSRFRETLL